MLITHFRREPAMTLTLEPPTTGSPITLVPQALFCQCGCARCAKYDHCMNRRCLQ